MRNPDEILDPSTDTLENQSSNEKSSVELNSSDGKRSPKSPNKSPNREKSPKSPKSKSPTGGKKLTMTAQAQAPLTASKKGTKTPNVTEDGKKKYFYLKKILS